MMSEPFDKKELLEELDDDLEFLAESFEIFTEDAEDLLQRLGEAMETGDSDRVASTAHTIKSMVGNFSAAPAHQAALELETLGKSGDLADGPAKLVKLQFEVDRLKQALGDLIEGLE